MRRTAQQPVLSTLVRDMCWSAVLKRVRTSVTFVSSSSKTAEDELREQIDRLERK